MAYTVTVHVDSGLIGGNGFGIGHAWYEISDGANSYTYGLYPASDADLILNGGTATVPGSVHVDDSNRPNGPMSASETYEITQSQFDALKARSDAFVANPPNYDLNDYNCTNFVRDGFASIGIELPHTLGNPITPQGMALDLTVQEILRQMSETATKLGEWFGGIIDGVRTGVSDFFTSSQLPPRRDPLTLDLDTDGLETVALNPTNPIYFDHDGDGVATATGWISPDDGFLALDRNANGTIDSGQELFGDATLIPDGAGGERTAVDGFEALSAQDTNLDGVVDANDTNFANLRIWQDLNSDAISQSNELFTLTQKGIASINVGKTENNTILPNGNVIADLGSYTKTDGTTATLGDTAQLGDIDLREDTFNSQFTNPAPLTPEAQALPNMQGSGQVRDLREAVSLSSNLTTLLTNYASAATRTDQLSQIDALIEAWSDTSTLATTATGAYVGHPLTITFAGVTNGTPEYQAWLDKLTVLERFNGRTFRVVSIGTTVVTRKRAGESDVRQEQYQMPQPELLGLLNTLESEYRWAA